MIYYIFNNFFPDNSGFVIRCKREIEALSRIDDVTVICRKRKEEKDIAFYNVGFKKIKIIRFRLRVELTERPRFYLPFFYEIYRNVDLLINLFTTLYIATLHKESNKSMFVICSPLTVPLIAFFIGKLNKVKCRVLEFHDLEPELSLHIKKIKKSNLIFWIELFLEKFVIKMFDKVIVTSKGQKEVIVKRNHDISNKIIDIPNTVNTKKKRKNKDLLNIDSKDFVVGYLSSFTFDYTITGVIRLIEQFHKILAVNPHIKLLIVGDGDGLSLIKKKARNNPNIIITGKVSNLEEIISTIHVGIIPWDKNEMTSTILPTKLFEYMANRIPIIAPDFGEFHRILTHKKTALLYKTIYNLQKMILELSRNNKLANQLTSNAYNMYVKDYTPKKYEEKLMKFISYA